MTDAIDPVSQYLDVLANDDRRAILRRLARSPAGTCTVDELVDTLADPGEGGTAEDRRERAHIRLYHVDLPALEDAGLVDYDWRSGDVSLAADRETTNALLERLKGAEWRTNDFYRSPSQ